MGNSEGKVNAHTRIQMTAANKDEIEKVTGSETRLGFCHLHEAGHPISKLCFWIGQSVLSLDLSRKSSLCTRHTR